MRYTGLAACVRKDSKIGWEESVERSNSNRARKGPNGSIEETNSLLFRTFQFAGGRLRSAARALRVRSKPLLARSLFGSQARTSLYWRSASSYFPFPRSRSALSRCRITSLEINWQDSPAAFGVSFAAVCGLADEPDL